MSIVLLISGLLRTDGKDSLPGKKKTHGVVMVNGPEVFQQLGSLNGLGIGIIIILPHIDK
jgi:hypothetical protein